MPQYLSTDPNAGLQLASAQPNRRYLSTDPNAGMDDQDGGGVSNDIPDPPSLTGRAGSFLSTVGNVLGSLGGATATTANELVKGQGLGSALKSGWDDLTTLENPTSFDDVLGSAGMKKGLGRSALGLLGDIVVDPLNLVGGAPVKAVAKALNAPKLVGASSRALKTVGTKIEDMPIAKDILDKFIQYRGTGNVMSQVDPTLSYRDIRRLGASNLRHADEFAASHTDRLVKNLTPAQRSEIALAMDKGITTFNDPEMTRVAETARTWIDEQVKKDLAAGTLNRKPPPNYVPKYAGEFANANPAERSVLHGITKQDSLASPHRIVQWKDLQEAAEQGGAITDIGEIVAKRLGEGTKANKTVEFMDNVVKHFGVTDPKNIPKGYRRLNPKSTLKKSFYKDNWSRWEEVWFPDKVATDLEKTMILDSSGTTASKIFSTGSKLWKSYALSLPGHQITNLIGNIANMHLGGMSIGAIGKTYAQATKWARQINSSYGMRVPKFGVKGFEDWEILKAINENEIIGTATQLGELGAERNALKAFRGKANPLNPDNAFLKTLKKGGQRVVEEPARIAFFVDRLKKGDSLEKAALRTKEVLFDYGELTDAERKIRNFVPFYTWTRKNLPLYLKSTITAPERMERHKDVLEFLNDTGGGDEFAQPEWMEESGYVASPIHGKDGTPAMVRAALPIHDLGLIPKGFSLEDFQNSGQRAAGMLAPWVKVPVELGLTGRELQSGVPVKKSSGLSTPAPLARLANAPYEALTGSTLPGMSRDTGELKQDDLAAYLMKQIPGFTWQGRAIPGVTEDDPLGGDQLPQWYESLGAILGFNPRLITYAQQKGEMEQRMTDWKRKVKEALEP